MSRSRRIVPSSVISVLLLPLLVSGGCNRSGLNLAHVEGVVTLDDKPVEDAAVLFLPDDPTMGPPASGTTDAEGRYTLITSNQPGAAIGAHRVAISKENIQIIPQRVGFPVYQSTYVVPPKYAEVETSGLVATVADDDNKQDFKLTTH